MKKTLLLFICLFFIQSIIAATYYSQCSCSPNTLANWNTNRAGGGSSPTNFTTTGDIFVVQNGHSMTTTATITFTLGASGKLQIENGGTFQADHQTIISSGTTFQIDNGGTYIQNNTSGMSSGIFGGTESFATNSNFIIKLSPNPFSSNIPFGNLTLDYTTMASDMTGVVLSVSGNFKVNSTGVSAFVIGNNTNNNSSTVGSLEVSGGKFYIAGTGANASISLNVTGDATISGGEFQVARTNLTGTYSASIGGNLTLSGGSIYCMNNNGTGGIIGSLSVAGNVIVSGGEIDLSRAGATNAGRLFLKGNFTQSGGNLRMSSTASSGSSGFYFEGTGSQTVIFSGGTQTSTTNVLNRFYYKTTSGPTALNETYSGSSAQNTITGTTGTPATGYAAWPTSGTLIKNVIFNNSAGVTLSNARTINTTLQLLSGTINNATNNITMASGSTIEKTNGSLSAAPIFAGTVNLLYSENAMGITNTGNEVPTSASVLNNVTLDNGNNVNLNSDMTINGVFDFNAGLLKCQNSKVLTFNQGSSHIGAGGQSYVVGKVSKIGNTAFTFPIGSDLLFRSVSISAPSNSTDKFSAQYFRDNPTSLFGTNIDLTLNNVSKVEYWDVSRDAGTSSVSVSLDWESITSGVNNSSDLRVAHWNNSLSKWENLGKTNTITANSTVGYVTSNVTSNFSPFTLGSTTTVNPLPVSLSKFEAKCIDKNVLIYWETASEKNNHYFKLEKSEDAKLWRTIKIENSKGNSSTNTNYSYEDLGEAKGNYYRLSQTDFDEKSEMFNTIFFDSKKCNQQQSVPFYNKLKKRIEWQQNNENTEIIIINLLGKEIIKTTTEENYIDLIGFEKNIYYAIINSSNFQYKLKFIVE